MHFLLPRRLVCALLIVCSLASSAWSDPVISGHILNPKNAAESWNVIRLVTRNVEWLLDEERLPEVPVQISYCSPALRTLPGLATDPGAQPKIEALVGRAFISVNAIATGAQQRNPAGARAALVSLRSLLEEMASGFDRKVVDADIFYCPLHGEFLSARATTPCATCGGRLALRRIPSSFIYTKPAEPTLRLTATANAKIAAGKAIDVKIRLATASGAPVRPEDLLEMHAQRIHLLIEEAGLTDYQHAHPLPTKVPGEYAFSFTAKKTAPYRIWADLVPTATGAQELSFVDLPSAGQASAVEPAGDRLTSTAGGYHFALSFAGNPAPPQARQTRRMILTVTDSAGHPVTGLEPVMNAFAHLVGFYADYRTVLILHPTGGDVLNPELRGGPALGFSFFPPQAGFLRLYCQVRIAGALHFAAFDLNVLP